MFLVDQTDTSNQIDTLEDTRDVVDQSTLDPAPFGFHGVSAGTKRVRGVCGGGGRHCGEAPLCALFLSNMTERTKIEKW